MARIAYADPPYIGLARRHYGPEAREVNHRILLAHLETFDAWALSASSPSLPEILGLVPEGVRIGAWVKPFCSFKPGVDPAYAWEPVIFKSKRKARKGQDTIRDWVSANITLKRGVVGAKPMAFCFWLFDLLGATPEDDFADIFPGSGAVATAWERWVFEKTAQTTMDLKGREK